MHFATRHAGNFGNFDAGLIAARLIGGWSRTEFHSSARLISSQLNHVYEAIRVTAFLGLVDFGECRNGAGLFAGFGLIPLLCRSRGLYCFSGGTLLRKYWSLRFLSRIGILSLYAMNSSGAQNRSRDLAESISVVVRNLGSSELQQQLCIIIV